MEKQFFSSEAAKILGIGASTLRKYSALLEKKGCHFKRGANNGRIFTHQDLDMITELIAMVNQKGMKLDEAAATIMGQQPTHEVDGIDNRDLLDFMEQMKELEEQQVILTEMNEKLAKQVERLAEKIDERERDQQLYRLIEEKRTKRKRKGIALLNPLSVFGGKN